MVALGEIFATKNYIVRICNLKIHDCYSVKIYNQFENTWWYGSVSDHRLEAPRGLGGLIKRNHLGTSEAKINFNPQVLPFKRKTMETFLK